MKTNLFLGIFLFILACSPDNLVEVKNGAGKVVEQFEVLEDSIKHGMYKAFYDNGKMLEEAQYDKGQLEGQRTLYYPNGQIEIIENYVGGRMIGDYKVYHENGQINISAEYVDGQLEGVLKKYYSTGTLEEEVTFENGEENGPFVEYHTNGQKKWEGQFLNGDNEFGELINYNEEGVLVKKMMCDSMAICRTTWTKEKGDITID